MSEDPKNQQFLLGLFGGIASVSVIGLIILGVFFLTSKNDTNPQVAGQQDTTGQNNQVQPAAQNPANVAGVATFSEKAGAEICKEDGKPVVYLFSTTWCPHCQWIKDAFDEVVKKYVEAGKIVAYHWEVDINDNALTPEKESVVPAKDLAIYREFNPGGSIPTFVFGCKYSRIGNGFEQQDDLNAEKSEFEALIKDIIK
ncbi:MAG: thioredoxin domain-containing protein [Candidatus Buchananbacteria bacterium]|nr:thioredoxin domain-containing protein [Candidatus Buchananbacteria bacterium]